MIEGMIQVFSEFFAECRKRWIQNSYSSKNQYQLREKPPPPPDAASLSGSFLWRPTGPFISENFPCVDFVSPRPAHSTLLFLECCLPTGTIVFIIFYSIVRRPRAEHSLHVNCSHPYKDWWLSSNIRSLDVPTPGFYLDQWLPITDPLNWCWMWGKLPCGSF